MYHVSIQGKDTMTQNEHPDTNIFSDDTESPSEAPYIDTVPHSDDEDELTVAEKRKGLSPKQVMGLAAAALVLSATAVGVGSKMSVPNERQQTTREAPAKPSAEKVPRAAELFAEQYDGRYADPVSTWYAREALKAETGTNFALPDGTIKTYEEIGDNRTPGNPFGFEQYKLPTGTELDESSTIDVFNNYTCKELTRYLNYLAKNPTPEAEAIIDKQFMTYCSNSSGAGFSDLAFTDDDRDIADLMGTMKLVVAKYGSTANYTVQQGELGGSDPNKTVFNDGSLGVQVNLDNEKEVTGSTIVGNVVISIDTYKNGTVTHTNETLTDVSMSITKQRLDDRGFNYLSIGQFKIHN